ncbi:MAG: hypothetical protein AAB018_05270, partial [Actinomycetota bacterium]
MTRNSAVPRSMWSLAIACLLVASFGTNSRAVALPTGTCSKIGVTKTVSGVKYICSKLAAQLVWTKLSAGSNSNSYDNKRLGSACSV